MIYQTHFGNIEARFDSLGGELVSFKKGGKEYVWTGDEKYWSGHSPVLFPVVCALLNGKTRFEGKEYEIQKHGLIRKREFDLISLKDNEAVFGINYDENTLKQYPYKFRFTVTHTLKENGFTTTYKTENADTRVMPFMVGGHAGFAVSSVNNVTLTFEKDEDCPLYLTNENGYMDKNRLFGKKIKDKKLAFTLADFDNDAIIATDLRSRRINVSDRYDGRSFDFIFNGLAQLGIWTPIKKDAPFFCLEAWNGAPAFYDELPDFESKPYIKKLLPNETYEASYGIEIK